MLGYSLNVYAFKRQKANCRPLRHDNLNDPTSARATTPHNKNCHEYDSVEFCCFAPYFYRLSDVSSSRENSQMSPNRRRELSIYTNCDYAANIIACDDDVFAVIISNIHRGMCVNVFVYVCLIIQ